MAKQTLLVRGVIHCLCFLSMVMTPIWADNEDSLNIFDVPCLIFPGYLHIVKFTFQDLGCIDEEDLFGEMETPGEPEKVVTNTFADAATCYGIFSSSDLKQENPQPGECFYNGVSLRCNFGPANDAVSMTVRVYFTADTPGTREVTGRVWLGAEGRENAVEAAPAPITILQAQTRLIYPWISNNQGQFESLLVANNTSRQEAQVQLTATRNNGDSETVTRTIPAAGSLRETASSLFPALGSGAGYSVLLESSQHRVSGHWVTNNLITGSGGSPAQGVAVNVTDLNAPWGARFGRDLMFGYLPITEGLTSAPVVVNLGPGPADIVLRFFDPAGNLVHEDTETLRALPPFRPFATVINDLVPPGSVDGHLLATSSNRLTGVAFVFNDQGEPAIGNALGVPP